MTGGKFSVLCSTPKVASERRMRGIQKEPKASRATRQCVILPQPSCSQHSRQLPPFSYIKLTGGNSVASLGPVSHTGAPFCLPNTCGLCGHSSMEPEAASCWLPLQSDGFLILAVVDRKP